MEEEIYGNLKLGCTNPKLPAVKRGFNKKNTLRVVF